jgi:hypothetical protein
MPSATRLTKIIADLNKRFRSAKLTRRDGAGDAPRKGRHMLPQDPGPSENPAPVGTADAY